VTVSPFEGGLGLESRRGGPRQTPHPRAAGVCGREGEGINIQCSMFSYDG